MAHSMQLSIGCAARYRSMTTAALMSMSGNLLKHLILLSSLIAVSASFVWSQQNTGSISGTVASGSSASGLVVRARNVETGEIVQTVTPGTTGAYTLANLPVPGTYLIELYDPNAQKVESTEGPFALTAAVPTLRDVSIRSGLAGVLGAFLMSRQLGAVIGAAGAGLAAATMAGGREQGGGENQTLCHHSGDGTLETITVPAPEVDAHMAHGDTAGACPASGSS
jgi:hypothetical protein